MRHQQGAKGALHDAIGWRVSLSSSKHKQPRGDDEASFCYTSMDAAGKVVNGAALLTTTATATTTPLAGGRDNAFNLFGRDTIQ